ncbi:S-layer homology domain-containing protein [Metalysinibacillus jejuensis]|uniref:S-layer homology domain-containing protein n=1 Tax=Metalysinibacillus jejuensis TaxID=914327 RepID=UPI000D335924|nr:S-layer homology domain-containing protein [Metalysinibacillus jejuensis]
MANQPKKYQKFVATAATATLVASAIVPVASAAETNFKDVQKDSEFAPYINDLVQKNIINGYPDGTFKPAAQLSRSNVVKMLGKTLVSAGHEIPTDWTTKERFTDVPLSTPDKDLIKYAAVVKDAGVFNGNTNGTLDPLTSISRQHMATVLVRMLESTYDVDLKQQVIDNKFESQIKDLDKAGEAHRDNIVALEYAKITTVTDNFRPTENVTRAQFAKFLSVALEVAGVNDEDPTNPSPGIVKDGITDVKAINDTKVEVTFEKEISADFIREAEKNGKYFAVYTEGNSVQSNTTVQSEKINFSKSGKTAEFTLATKDALESGKKYYVALLDGPNNKVADVKHYYGPAVLKEAANKPEFEVSAVADKIFVDYSTKMKDSALTVDNYKVFDEGGKELGPLKDFLNTKNNKEGKWVDLNDKEEVEFKLGVDSKLKLSAGKTYKLVVSEKVKTDDNKTLSESERTIKVTTPSIDEASPEAKVARIVNENTIEIVFNQDIDGKNVTINPAQLDVRTSTGKTVNVKKVDTTLKSGTTNTLVLKLDTDSDNKLDKGTTYKVDMPANVVKNGIFVNAMNKSTTGLEAKAQENVSIKELSAKIEANAKNNAQADLILTFDQVPVIDSTLVNSIQLFDKRDEYKLKDVSINDIKYYGGDETGKSIIIEGMNKFHNADKGNLAVRGDKSYDIEIKAGKVTTDSFDTTAKATNKDKLVASTSGVVVAHPIVDEARLQSAEKIEIDFKENIKGNIEASDIQIDAYVANRSDIFDGKLSKNVSGSGFFSVEISGKTLTITAKEGVKFPTSIDAANFTIAKDVFTNETGKVGNPVITAKQIRDAKDMIDNAAPVLVGAEATTIGNAGKGAKLTFSENVKTEGSTAELASLFFSDKGENATEGVKASFSGNIATIEFKEAYWINSTDLTKVTVEYSQGNSFYLQDGSSNKVETQKIIGLVKGGTSTVDPDPTEPTDPEQPTEGETVKVSEITHNIVVNDIERSTNVSFKLADLPAQFEGKALVIEYKGQKYDLIVNKYDKTVIFATLPAVLKEAEVAELNVSVK